MRAIVDQCEIASLAVLAADGCKRELGHEGRSLAAQRVEPLELGARVRAGQLEGLHAHRRRALLEQRVELELRLG